MKKIFPIILSLLSASAVYALPVGNPIDASLYTDGIFWCNNYDECDPCPSLCSSFSMRIGFWGDYVFDRHMETDKPGNTATRSFQNNSTIQKFSIYKNQGVLVFNWADWWDIWGLVGAANFSQISPALDLGNVRGTTIMLYSPTISYGAGSRMTLWNCGCFGLGIEGQYFGAQPKLNSYEFVIDGITNYVTGAKASTYTEWQVGLGASYRVEGYGNSLVPYIAVKFAGATLTQNNTAYASSTGDILTQGNLCNQKSTGFAVGMTATSADKVGITVEGRFADETAVFVNGQIRF